MQVSEMITVLVVEDNPGDAVLISQALGRGHPSGSIQMVRAETAAAAVDVLTERPIDVVVSDLGLPDSQGLDTLTAIRGAAPDVPVVVLTVTEDDETGVEAIRRGAQDYLVKGQLEPSLLARSIRYALERHRLQARLGELEAVRKSEANRRRQAIEINDNVIQALAVAKMAHELGQHDEVAEALGRAIEAARRMVGEILDQGDSGVVEPGELVRDRPADASD
jgi:DNA-binding NtrC family response regulator